MQFTQILLVLKVEGFGMLGLGSYCRGLDN